MNNWFDKSIVEVENKDNKVIEQKKETINHNQKKAIRYFALILFILIFIGLIFASFAIDWDTIANATDGAIKVIEKLLPKVVMLGGAFLLIVKTILTIVHWKKISNLPKEEYNEVIEELKKGEDVSKVTKGNKNVIKSIKSEVSFQINGFTFVETKTGVNITLNKVFKDKEDFINAFKYATNEYCEKIRKQIVAES